MKYERYKIPPNFEICEIHKSAALVYKKLSEVQIVCPCCGRSMRSERISLCSDTWNLSNIGEEIPLFFSFIKVLVLILLFLMIFLIGEFNFTSTSLVTFQFQFTQEITTALTLGFVQINNTVAFIRFCTLAFVLLLIRIFMKRKKYQVENLNQRLSKRSLRLSNLHPKTTQADILAFFQDYRVLQIFFVGRLYEYQKSLQKYYKLRKKLQILKKTNNAINSEDLIEELIMERNNVRELKRYQNQPKNKLDMAFITFQSVEARDRAYNRFHVNFFKRLFYKCCTCFSVAEIRSRHVTLTSAPDPQDINWICLENEYLAVKARRGVCYFMCASILAFGVGLDYSLSSLNIDNDLIRGIGKSMLILLTNFLIVNLIQYTSKNIQDHETNTEKQMSLMKKLSFFLFLNLSMAPIAVYVYCQYFSNQKNCQGSFDTLCFSVLFIALGNIFKPLTILFDFERISKYLGFRKQKRIKQKCEMTQIQANLQFQPIQFPISLFYAIMLSSIFMISFFASVFQLLIAVELVAIILVFIVAKYMLLRICKEPLGLKKKTSILAQRMLNFILYNYWVGQKIMVYFVYKKSMMNFEDYIFQEQAYTFVQLGIIGFMIFFSSKLTSKVSHCLFKQNQAYTSSFLLNANQNVNILTYEQAHAKVQLEEDYVNAENDHQ